MPDFHDFFLQYDKLCNYCDRFWDTVVAKYPGQIMCKSGCSTCCELQSVNALEACSLIRHLQQSDPTDSIRNFEYTGCPFLNYKTCSVYHKRPLICRTHGLLISSSEDEVFLTCPSNFPNITEDFPKNYVLDSEKITSNLMRLNLAFCIAANHRETASVRFLLSDIASQQYSTELKHLLEFICIRH